MSQPSPSSKVSRTGSHVRATLAGGVVTIHVEGRFDFGCHPDFRHSYEGFGAVSDYIVDLEATEYLDSSALGMLLVLREVAGSGHVRIVNCGPAVRRILEVANFNRLFALE